ncbi:MAG TPA: hypothetical protein VHS96_09125, partial [Bacteroidia bacterium]|nr:hypothetical protein [Bacteroidia bacterium]
MKRFETHPAQRLPLHSLVGILCCILLMAACSRGTEEQRKRQSLPDFHFESWDGGELQRSDLPEDKP